VLTILAAIKSRPARPTALIEKGSALAPKQDSQPNEASFTSVQNNNPIGSFVSGTIHPAKIAVQPRIRPFDEFYFTGPLNQRYHPLAKNFFFAWRIRSTIR